MASYWIHQLIGCFVCCTILLVLPKILASFWIHQLIGCFVCCTILLVLPIKFWPPIITGYINCLLTVGSSWSWSYGSWIYSYLCNQCLMITTKVVSSNLAQANVYSTQHYVIKFVSDLRQVYGFLRVLRFPPPIKLTAMI